MSDVSEKVNDIMERALMAQAVFSQLDQAQTDRIVRRVCRAGFDNRVKLARMAAEETGIGVWQHKVLKNVLATQLVYEDIKDEKTVGVLARDETSGIVEIAQPLGPILAITPVTNPTSTALFKILICLKTRNPIIISSHRKALKCCREVVRICSEAAREAGAPDDCIQILPYSSREFTQALMTHPAMALILATGGMGLVKEAYSSGTPAIGVGPGNVPVYVDASADIPFAVRSIILSKTFDNGTVCASEQAVVVEAPLAAALRSEFEAQGCRFLDAAETAQLEAFAVNHETGLMNPEVVGQPAAAIAARAGFAVPAETKILIAPLDGVGAGHALSHEVLAPILAFYVCADYEHAVKTCLDLNYLGGVGHTASIYANDDARIQDFAELMNAGRVVVNTPSSQGAVGGMFNTLLASLTLGCGSGGKNITTENISARHLINIKKICRRRDNERWVNFDHGLYLDESRDFEAVSALYHKNH